MDQPQRNQLYGVALARAVQDGIFDEATASRLSSNLQDLTAQLERYRSPSLAINPKLASLAPPRPRPAGERTRRRPAAEASGDGPATGYTKGAEVAAAAGKECKEAEARRQKAVEALKTATGRNRQAARAAAQEEDAAIAFHKSAQAYGHALMEAHEDNRVTAEEARLLVRLQGEMSLRRKKYDEARAQKSKLQAD